MKQRKTVENRGRGESIGEDAETSRRNRDQQSREMLWPWTKENPIIIMKKVKFPDKCIAEG
jgi:hypothetical protein